jgi:hypothetical protein
MEKVLTPHQGRLSWEEVYKGWKSEKYRFHWRKFSLKPVAKHPWPVEDAIEQGK